MAPEDLEPEIRPKTMTSSEVVPWQAQSDLVYQSWNESRLSIRLSSPALPPLQNRYERKKKNHGFFSKTWWWITLVHNITSALLWSTLHSRPNKCITYEPSSQVSFHRGLFNRSCSSASSRIEASIPRTPVPHPGCVFHHFSMATLFPQHQTLNRLIWIHLTTWTSLSFVRLLRI